MPIWVGENGFVETRVDSPKGDVYEAPALVMHGSIADITGAALPGSTADHTLPAGAVGVNAVISL